MISLDAPPIAANLSFLAVYSCEGVTGAFPQVLSFAGLTAFGSPKKSRGSGVFTNTEDTAPSLWPARVPR
jgi:hypothetical protein